MAYACNCPPGHHDGSVYRLCVVRESTSNDIVRCPPIPPGPATVSCEAALMVVCPHGNAAASYCALCLRGRIAELESEAARLRESEPLTYRGQRDAAIAEVARLEALIVSWGDDEDRYSDPARSLRDEADRIRRRQ